MTEQKWISVKQHLPEPYTKVLVFDAGDAITYLAFILDNPPRWSYEESNITHWTMLPDPPEE